MDTYNVQVLFLHNLTPQNTDTTIQNFNSFKSVNTDIIGVCDEDQKGLEGSFYVPLNSYIPRGSRRWSPETVILNYALINKDKLNHSHYMFCEYDCYTDCNINELCDPYKNYDIVAPRIIHYHNEQNWQWFQPIKKKININKLIGFRPSVFILFKKEALIKLALAYQKLWKIISNLNSEVRLGFLSKHLKFEIGEFKDLKINIEWFEIKFIKNNKIYHPVKKIIDQDLFINYQSADQNPHLIGDWHFGRLGERNFLGTVSLNADNTITNYDNFNEKFWEGRGDDLLFYNGSGGLTTHFRKVKDNIYHGDYYNGGKSNNSRVIKNKYHILIRTKH